MRRLAHSVLLGLVLAACTHTPDRGTGTEAAASHVVDGRAAARAGDHALAVEHFEAAIAAEPMGLDAHRLRSQSLFELGRISEAVDDYRARLTQDPDNPGSLYGLAIALYASSTENADEALSLLARAEKALPGEADIPFRRGVIHLDAEAWDPAREALGRAVSLDPDSARYRIPYALVLFHTGHPKESLQNLEGVLQLDPDPKSVLQARAVVSRIVDPFRDLPPAARSRVEKATQWIERADVPQNALDMLREVLLEYPESAMVNALIGLAYQRIESSGQALYHLNRAIELAPDLPQPRLFLGNFYYGKNKYAEARKAYLEAIERNPLYLEAHMMLGRMARDRGDDPEALQHLKAWALLTPDRSGPRLELARVQAGTGDLDGAEASLESVLELDAGNLEAHLSLATILARRWSLARTEEEKDGYARKGLAHLEPVLDAQPDNAAALRLREALRQ